MKKRTSLRGIRRLLLAPVLTFLFSYNQATLVAQPKYTQDGATHRMICKAEVRVRNNHAHYAGAYSGKMENRTDSKLYQSYPIYCADTRDGRPVIHFDLDVFLNYYHSHLCADSVLWPDAGDETAGKLVKILRGMGHDNYVPLTKQVTQPITAQPPLGQCQDSQLSSQLILWHKFYSLLIY